MSLLSQEFRVYFSSSSSFKPSGKYLHLHKNLHTVFMLYINLAYMLVATGTSSTLHLQKPHEVKTELETSQTAAFTFLLKHLNFPWKKGGKPRVLPSGAIIVA